MNCPRCRAEGCLDPDSKGCSDNVIMRQNAEISRYQEALIWCSASEDFQEGGKARTGWVKLGAPLLKEITLAPRSDLEITCACSRCTLIIRGGMTDLRSPSEVVGIMVQACNLACGCRRPAEPLVMAESFSPENKAKIATIFNEYGLSERDLTDEEVEHAGKLIAAIVEEERVRKAVSP